MKFAVLVVLSPRIHNYSGRPAAVHAPREAVPQNIETHCENNLYYYHLLFLTFLTLQSCSNFADLFCFVLLEAAVWSLILIIGRQLHS